MGTSDSPDIPEYSEEAQVSFSSTRGALTSSTIEGEILDDASPSVGDQFFSVPDSVQPVTFNQGQTTQSIQVDWTFTHMPSQVEELKNSPSIEDDTRPSSLMRTNIQQAAPSQGSQNRSHS
ncbi:hypothetical protein KRZ98_23880, partial [Sphingobium sp. AS12]|uniref:hypothetical protein n=1 Tax=Sphingobium sp. AS12 TaxID=2849495 RepID=UPI001C315D4A